MTSAGGSYCSVYGVLATVEPVIGRGGYPRYSYPLVIHRAYGYGRTPRSCYATADLVG